MIRRAPPSPQLLSEDARDLLAETRALDEPSIADRARLRARLDASWAESAAVTTQPPPLRAAGARASFWLGGIAFIAAVSLATWLLLGKRADESVAVSRSSQPAAENAAAWRSRSGPPASSTSRHAAPLAPEHAAASSTLEQSRPSNSAQKHTRLQRTAANPSAATGPTPTRTRARASSTQTAVEPALPRPEAPRSTSSDPAPSAEVDSASTQQSSLRSRGAARGGPRSVVEPEPVDTTRPAFVADAIAAEVALLGAAQDALQTGKPSRALTLVQEHAFRFPSGALTQERLAVHTLALCALQRKAAAKQVFEVLARRGQSAPVVARVRRDCGF